MVVYTVHEPPKPQTNPLERGTRLVFIKDRFHWLAAVFPAIWLLVKRMWRELAAYLVLMSVLIGVLNILGATQEAISFLIIIVQIVFGFEAGALYRASLRRRGWSVVGTVAGRNAAECERRFFEAWLPQVPTGPLHETSTHMADEGDSSWIETTSAQVKDAIGRWRRLAGAKA